MPNRRPFRSRVSTSRPRSLCVTHGVCSCIHRPYSAGSGATIGRVQRWPHWWRTPGVIWQKSCGQHYCGGLTPGVIWRENYGQNCCGRRTPGVIWQKSCGQHYCGGRTPGVIWRENYGQHCCGRRTPGVIEGSFHDIKMNGQSDVCVIQPSPNPCTHPDEKLLRQAQQYDHGLGPGLLSRPPVRCRLLHTHTHTHTITITNSLTRLHTQLHTHFTNGIQMLLAKHALANRHCRRLKVLLPGGLQLQ